MNLPIIFVYSLLTGLTAVYCVLIWYGAGMWWVFINHSDFGRLPLLSLFCLAPLPLPLPWQMIHWQFLAILSLIVCISRGISSSCKKNNDTGHALPIAVHTLWILFVICCHLLAAFMPMVAVGHIIK